MNLPSSVSTGIRNGLLTALYIAFVVSFMQNASQWFGGPDMPYLTPFMGITLFVVSALITGSLVLWTPLRLVTEGSHYEAWRMLLSTGLTLVFLLVAASVISLAVR